MGLTDYLAIAALLACIALAIPSIFLAIRHHRLDSKFELFNDNLASTQELAESNAYELSLIPKALLAMKTNHSAFWTIFEEKQKSGNINLDLANEILASESRHLVRCIHHITLVGSNEEKALKSAWMLATEFGDIKSVSLMTKLESTRSDGLLEKFKQYRMMLEERLDRH